MVKLNKERMMSMFGKKRKLTHFEKEELRIQQKLEELDVGSPEYDKMQSELDKLYSLHDKRKDGKRRISRDSKGKILNTMISGLCLGGLAFGISRFELKGNLFTGDNKGSINAITKIASRIFFGV